MAWVLLSLLAGIVFAPGVFVIALRKWAFGYVAADGLTGVEYDLVVQRQTRWFWIGSASICVMAFCYITIIILVRSSA